MKFFLIAVIFCSSVTGAIAGLAVNCQGEGTPVYLIGGGPAFTTWHLEPIQRRISQQFRVCRWDMRGVGENAAAEIDVNVPVLTQWLRDMADELPRQPVLIWGHSWGALQSLLFASRYPERVKALVLNNPVDPELKSLQNIEFKRFVHPYVESQLKLDDIGTATEQVHRFRSKIASYFLDAKTGWDYSAQFGQDDTNNELNVQIWQEYRKMALKPNDLKQLSSKLSSLIYCQHDVLMPENFDSYSAVIPRERHHVIDDCAHFPWVESPQAFYQLLLRSLSEAR